MPAVATMMPICLRRCRVRDSWKLPGVIGRCAIIVQIPPGVLVTTNPTTILIVAPIQLGLRLALDVGLLLCSVPRYMAWDSPSFMEGDSNGALDFGFGSTSLKIEDRDALFLRLSAKSRQVLHQLLHRLAEAFDGERQRWCRWRRRRGRA